MKYIQDQESFSFSTSSKTSLFSDDEDCGHPDDHNHTKTRIANHQQSGYFEISLPPPSPSINKTEHEDTKEEEFEFCLSFNSSSTRLIEFPITPLSTSHRHDVVGNVVDKKRDHHHNRSNNTISYKRIYQRVSSPRCRQGLVSPYVLPCPNESQQVTRLRAFEKNQRELSRNRKSSKLVCLRKFMVKLRSIKKMLRSSIHASRRLKSSQVDKVIKKTNTPLKDHRPKDFSNVVLDVRDEKGIHGFSKMLDVVMKNIGITRRRSKQTGSKSCPVSIKSSPMHDPDGNTRDERRNSFYSRDHSIQAAIAHCKKSFGK